MALLVGSGTAAYFAVTPPASAPPPGFVCAQPDKNFGEVGQGDTLEADFELTNNYPVPVEITDVQTGCSCRAAVVSRKFLGTGEKSVVSVKWSIGTRRGNSADTIWVTHTVPGQSGAAWMPIRIGATVQPDIVREPREFTFRVGQADVRRVKLTPGRQPSFTASDPYSSTRKLSARYVAESAEVEVRYTPTADTEDGDEAEVVVKTSSPHEPQMRIPVRFTRP